MNHSFLDPDGSALRSPEGRVWMYAAGKQVMGSRFSRERFMEALRRADRDEGAANRVTMCVVGVWLVLALVWAAASSPRSRVDARNASTTAHEARRESTLGLGPEAAVREGGGR